MGSWGPVLTVGLDRALGGRARAQESLAGALGGVAGRREAWLEPQEVWLWPRSPLLLLLWFAR